MTDDDSPSAFTFDHGRFVFAKPKQWSGGGSRGEQRTPIKRDVLITFGGTQHGLPDWYRYQAPGIAPLLFLGDPDSADIPGRAYEFVANVVIEAMPQGVTLHQAGRLDAHDVVRVGLGLCDTLLACDARGVFPWGLGPETIYVVSDGPGGYRYAGATPRSYALAGRADGYARVFAHNLEWYCPPEFTQMGPAGGVFTVALMLWYALLGENALIAPGGMHMELDARRPFTGPPELGHLLEAALVEDVEQRLPTAALRDGLARLAARWGVDLPPFPPPGLAEPQELEALRPSREVKHDYTNPVGLTLGRKRFVFDRHIAGAQATGIWLGTQKKPVRRTVQISYAERMDSDLARCKYDVPGVAPLLFLGSPDGYRRPRQWLSHLTAVIEAIPEGTTLHRLGRLGPGDVVRVGLGLCDTLLAAEARGVRVAGLRPETVYAIADGAAGYRYAGATPRSYQLLRWFAGYASPFALVYSRFDLDEGDPRQISAAYTVALLIWYALLGEYAIMTGPRVPPNPPPRPFTGPAELGRILEAALTPDVAKRSSTAALRVELAGLAARWGVALPPFPPPGLADS